MFEDEYHSVDEIGCDLTEAQEAALYATCPPSTDEETWLRLADEHDAEVATRRWLDHDPEDDLDHGPVDPELWPRVTAPSPARVLERAVAALDAGQRHLQRMEAGRIAALLDAYDATMVDAAEAGEPTARHQWVAKGFLVQAGRSLRMSERGAAHLLDTARSLRDDLPLTWGAFLDGRCPWRLADIAERQSQGLHTLDLPEYDEAAARYVATDASPELTGHLHRLRERLDPESAAHRRRAATANRQVTVAPLPDGQGSLTLIGPAVEIAALDDGLQRAAVALHGHPDEDRGIQALRFDVAAELLLTGLATDAPTALPEGFASDGDSPEALALAAAVRAAVAASGEESTVETLRRIRVPHRRAVKAKVLLVVPALSIAGRSNEPAELAGFGPIDIDQATWTAGAQDSWTRVFTDPVTGDLTAVDAKARAIPAALRAWLQARDGTCRAPGCSRPAIRLDLDHVERFEHDGPTAHTNLVHLCRPHHGVKDDGCWKSHLHADGAVTWRSRWGTSFTTEPAMRPAPTPPPPPAAPVDDVPAPF